MKNRGILKFMIGIIAATASTLLSIWLTGGALVELIVWIRNTFITILTYKIGVGEILSILLILIIINYIYKLQYKRRLLKIKNDKMNISFNYRTVDCEIECEDNFGYSGDKLIILLALLIEQGKDESILNFDYLNRKSNGTSHNIF